MVVTNLKWLLRVWDLQYYAGEEDYEDASMVVDACTYNFPGWQAVFISFIHLF